MRRIAGLVCDVLCETWSEVWRMRLRTALAIASIAVGAFGVSLMASAYDSIRVVSARARTRDWLIIMVSDSQDPLRRRSHLLRRHLLPEDAEAIRRECPFVERVIITGVHGTADAKAGRRAVRVVVTSTSAASEAERLLDDSFGWRDKLAWGREFTPGEIARGERVAILSDWVRSELFGDAPLDNAVFRLNGVKFAVVGAEAPRPAPAPSVVVPYTYAQKHFPGSLGGAGFDRFYARPKPGTRKQAMRSIDAILTRRLGDPGESFVNPGSRGGDAGMMRFAVYGGLMGLLVLVSAGFALSNKMYIDVIERIDQIAVRRALGATARRIHASVLLESALLSGTGGVLGGGLGWLLVAALAGRSEGGLAFPLLPCGLVLAFTLGIGITAGLQAASVATAANPAELLGRKDVV